MNKLKDMNEEKRIYTYLIIIEIVFMAIAIFSIFTLGDSLLLGSLEKFDNDDAKYIRSAWNLLDNNILSYENIKEATAYIMPGLTYILSLFMFIFGKINGIVAFRIFQAILQGISLYLLFLIGKKVFNSKVALIACFMDALYIAEIYAANLILMEVIFKFLLLLLIYISIYAIEKKSLKLYILGGMVWAIGCLFRPTIAAYPLLILIMWIKDKYSFGEMFKYTIVVTSIFCIIMAPWWIRNYKVFDRVILFTKSSGNPFLQGTFINYDQSKGLGVPYIKGKDVLESNENEMKAGLQRLKIYGKKEPLKYIAWYTLGKTFYFWRAPFYWVINISYIPVIIYHFIILFYALYGMIKYKDKSLNLKFLIMVVIYFNIIYLPYYTFERYSYPLMPLVILFAAYTINDKRCKRIELIK
ncbi:ArnT family glycosyltransferase [Desnuesiella massiliensis]|uniref:ArnT family glycosyltransferase n=1 Tax=Desnuesiella massiliensis TaxID=1650662 RepID=UPI000AD0BCCC|nr:glycosyltransferase family 39 protein [Desnuesiella massiliensis]